MNLRRSVCQALLGLLLVVLAGSGFAGVGNPPGNTGDVRDRIVPGVIIIKLRPVVRLNKTESVDAAVLARMQSLGIQQVTRIFPGIEAATVQRTGALVSELSRMFYGTMRNGEDPRLVARRAAMLPEVEYAEPKYYQRLLDVPNDPQFTLNQASYFAAMHVPDAWSIVKGSAAAVIADVDGGTDWTHPDLSPNLWINAAEDINHNGKFDPGPPPAGDEDGIDQDGDGYKDDVIGWNFTWGNGNPQGSSSTPESWSHGTATASHVGAATNNGIGMAGTSWNCPLMLINGASRATDNAIEFGYEGIGFAALRGARVINCSWGRLGSYSQFEADIVRAATAAGALIVAAAGNYGASNDVDPHYPSSFKEVLSVGATVGASDVKADFSDYGLSVEVFAPGVDIWSALIDGGYGSGGSGTSYSSPLTAGLAGLLVSQHPAWTPRQVATQIRVTSDPIDAANPGLGGALGHGKVNFLRAVTETHPGLEIVASTLKPLSGRDYVVRGDTVRLSVTVKNILPATATNIQFQVSSSSPTLRPLAASATLGSLAVNEQAVLPDFIFVADTVTTARRVAIALRWVSNSVDNDAVPFTVVVFETPPSWLLQETPTQNSLFSVKAVTQDIIWAAGGSDSATGPVVLRTVDGGTTWNDVTGDLRGVNLYCITAVDSSHAWVGTSDGRIFGTTTGGAQWIQQSYPAPTSPFIDGVWFFDPVHGAALGDPPSGSSRFVLLRTSDGGTTWSHMPSEPTGASGEAGWNNSWWWVDPQHGWFGTNMNRVWRTADGGTSWQSAPTGGNNSVAVAFGTVLNGAVAHDDGLVSYTTDGGVSWVPGAHPASNVAGLAFAPGSLNAWLVSPGEPFRSDNGGVTWVSQTAFPFNGSLLHVSALDSVHAWASTSFGQILRYVPGTADTIPHPVTVTAYALGQNHPNPFALSTKIAYDIPEGGQRVTITVYDVLGRAVQTIEDRVRDSGRYEAIFYGTGYATGVYFYRIQAGGFSAVKKMLLLK